MALVQSAGSAVHDGCNAKKNVVFDIAGQSVDQICAQAGIDAVFKK